jgi:hypothetical protein
MKMESLRQYLVRGAVIIIIVFICFHHPSKQMTVGYDHYLPLID